MNFHFTDEEPDGQMKSLSLLVNLALGSLRQRVLSSKSA